LSRESCREPSQTLPPISLHSGSGVSITPGEKVHFAWREVDGAKSYRLKVLSASDSSTIFQKVTELSSITQLKMASDITSVKKN